MGVDTRLYISREWGIQDVVDVLCKRFDIRAEIEFHAFAPEYITLNFEVPSNGRQRSLHIFLNSNVGGFPAINLNFHSDPEGQEILKILAKTFGGLFQETDCYNDFEVFRKPGEENIDFVVREGIKHDPTLGDKCEEMAKYIAEEKWKTYNVPQKIKETK